MKTSQTIAALATALAAAQGEFTAPTKDHKLKTDKYVAFYADLAGVWEVIRAPLAKHGLAIVQAPRANGVIVTVETMLVHKSGEFISDEFPATAGGNGPQAIGSVVTYLRRYGLCAMLGIAAEDDDGKEGGQERRSEHNAERSEHKEQESKKPPEPPSQPTDEKAADKARATTAGETLGAFDNTLMTRLWAVTSKSWKYRADTLTAVNAGIAHTIKALGPERASEIFDSIMAKHHWPKSDDNEILAISAELASTALKDPRPEVTK